MKFKIYGREGCSQCMTAKSMIHRAKKKNSLIEYEYLNYDEHLEYLQSLHAVLPKTLPVITLNESGLILFHELDQKLTSLVKG